MKNIISEKPQEICREHYLLKAEIPDMVSHPGQFVNIRIGDQTDPLFFIGTSFKLKDRIRIFIETVHVKEYYGIVGIKYDF